MILISFKCVGNYWLDPNEGDIKDAILVYCDMKKRASCVISKPERSQEINYQGKEMEVWLGDIENGLKVNNYNFNN